MKNWDFSRDFSLHIVTEAKRFFAGMRHDISNTGKKSIDLGQQINMFSPGFSNRGPKREAAEVPVWKSGNQQQLSLETNHSLPLLSHPSYPSKKWKMRKKGRSRCHPDEISICIFNFHPSDKSSGWKLKIQIEISPSPAWMRQHLLNIHSRLSKLSR